MTALSGLFTLGRDAEIRATANGEHVATLALAYNYGRKDENGKQPTQWVRATIWGKRAQSVAPHLTKGKQISALLDEVHIKTFNKQDGSQGVSLEGRVIDLEFVRSIKADAPAPAPAPKPAPKSSGFDDMDDVPF